MPTISITKHTIDAFDAVTVANGALALTLIPELGGKIAHLRDLRSGRDWLWRNPRMAYKRGPYGPAYGAEADTGGWDECFPTVAPCVYPTAPWQHVNIQDHGELWSQLPVFEISEHTDRVILHTRWRGVSLPYSFERAVILTADSTHLRVEYAVTNTSDAAVAFIWCAHALLAIAPGMQLRTPPPARFNRWASVPADLLSQHTGLSFPLSVRVHETEIDLATLPDGATGLALKLWSDPLDQGWVTLHAPDGELRMRWDVAKLPQVALWVNLGAWAGDGGEPYYNLGLEPCIGAQDSLAEAVERNLVGMLPPRGTRSWWLEVELAA